MQKNLARRDNAVKQMTESDPELKIRSTNSKLVENEKQ